MPYQKRSPSGGENLAVAKLSEFLSLRLMHAMALQPDFINTLTLRKMTRYLTL